MKLYYSRLQIELTRRCNQSCLHCCRGESQNIDLSNKIVDIFFEKNDIYHISNLLFSGGEPTLNGKTLEYIVDKIIEKEIIVDTFMLSINGLTYSKELIKGLNKLQKYIISKSENPVYQAGLLLISQTQFHEVAKKEVVEKLKDLPYFHPIERYTLNEKEILPYGRALENGLSKQQKDLSNLTDYQKNYKIKEYNNTTYLIIDYQYIAANGNIINSGFESYNLMDKYALGNVESQSIEELYLQKQKRLTL